MCLFPAEKGSARTQRSLLADRDRVYHSDLKCIKEVAGAQTCLMGGPEMLTHPKLAVLFMQGRLKIWSQMSPEVAVLATQQRFLVFSPRVSLVPR